MTCMMRCQLVPLLNIDFSSKVKEKGLHHENELITPYN